MKIGKVSQTVLKRSMLKPLQLKRKEAIFQPSVEEMCYGITCESDEQIICTDTVLYGNEKNIGVFALAQTLNHLATRNAKPVGVSVHIILPPYAYESRLKAMIECIENAGSEYNVQVLCAKAEVSPAVTMAVVQMSGLGICKQDEWIQSAMAKPGQDIVLLNYVGLEGTLRIMQEKQTELEQRFVHTFLNQLRQMERQLFVTNELQVAKEDGVSAMHQITDGGILAALWEMAESANVGLEVELKKMTIRQETVEICEYFHLNPYQLTSAGSVLIVAEQGEALVEKYREMGVQAVLLGKTTDSKERVILGGEEKRFLDRPAADELLKIYEKEI